MSNALMDITHRVLSDEVVTDEEYRALIDSLRGDRRSGSRQKKSAVSDAAKKLPENLDDLFK